MRRRVKLQHTCVLMQCVVLQLPVITGGQVEAPPANDFVVGDRIRCDVDMDLLNSLQDNPTMAEKISLVGSPCNYSNDVIYIST